MTDLAARRAIEALAAAMDADSAMGKSFDFPLVVKHALAEKEEAFHAARAEWLSARGVPAAAPVEPENATDPPRCPNCGSTKTGPTSGNGVGNTMDCLACYADFTPADAPVEPEEGGCDVCSNPNCYRNILPEDGK